MVTNPLTPQILNVGSISFSATETNKTINLLTGIGYLGVVLDVRNTNGTSFAPNKPFSDEEFRFEFRKDGNTVVQYYDYDVLYANSILTNLTPIDKPTADGVVGGAVRPDSSICLPLAPVKLAPVNTLQSICHSTLDSQNFSLNIDKKAGTALTIDVYAVKIETDKPTMQRYLYAERIDGTMNTTITGFSTSTDSFIYGYNFSIDGDLDNEDQYRLYLRVQGQEVFQNIPLTCLGDVTNLMGGVFRYLPSASVEGSNNRLAASIRFNYNYRYNQGISTRSIDDTQFRISSLSTAQGANSAIRITHYQMRDNA